MTEVTKDRDFLKELNHQLELNQTELQKKCKRLEDISRATIVKKDEELNDLREQVEFPWPHNCWAQITLLAHLT